MMVEMIDLTVGAIFVKRCQGFTLGVGDFPARPAGMEIGRTFFVDILRAVHYLPAGVLGFRKM